MTAILPAHLSETLNSLGGAAQALTDEVRTDRDQRAAESAALIERQRKQNQRIMALLVVVTILVGSLVTISVANRKLGIANSQLNKQNALIVQRIDDCTTPGKPCYEQSRKRTGEAAALIIQGSVRGSVYAQICLRNNPRATDEEIEACVYARLQKLDAERTDPKPTPSASTPAPPTSAG